MLRRDTARKEQFPVLNRLHQGNLRLVAGIKTENTGRENNGVLPVPFHRLGDNAVQFSGIDKIKTFRLDFKRLHIDFKPESTF